MTLIDQDQKLREQEQKLRELVIAFAVSSVKRYVKLNTGIFRFTPKSSRAWTEDHLADAFREILDYRGRS